MSVWRFKGLSVWTMAFMFALGIGSVCLANDRDTARHKKNAQQKNAAEQSAGEEQNRLKAAKSDQKAKAEAEGKTKEEEQSRINRAQRVSRPTKEQLAHEAQRDAQKAREARRAFKKQQAETGFKTFQSPAHVRQLDNPHAAEFASGLSAEEKAAHDRQLQIKQAEKRMGKSPSPFHPAAPASAHHTAQPVHVMAPPHEVLPR